MKILIIEDDKSKSQNLMIFLKQSYQGNYTVLVNESYQSGLKSFLPI